MRGTIVQLRSGSLEDSRMIPPRADSQDTAPRNNAANTRGKPFERGNPGRPKGARHKATLAAEALLDGEAEGLTMKAVELALGGDTVALRLCLERVLPSRKDRPVSFSLPEINTAADAVKASGALLQAVAVGDVTPSEASELGKLLESHARVLEASELEER